MDNFRMDLAGNGLMLEKGRIIRKRKIGHRPVWKVYESIFLWNEWGGRLYGEVKLNQWDEW